MTKIDIFSGFLGAGKTTLIKKLIAEAYAGEKLVLIENEFGEIGIDGGFMKEAGVTVNELNSGCICCSLVGDFAQALHKVITDFAPDRVLIEPSGVGKLSDIVAAVRDADVENTVLGSTVTVVDAGKCKMYMKNFGEFFNDQVAHAGTILLSRTAGLDEHKLAACVALLREHNAAAAIVTTPWDALTGKQILAAMEGGSQLAAELAELAEEAKHHHHHHGPHADACSHDHHDDDGEECSCGHHHHGPHADACSHDHHHDDGEDCTCGHHHHGPHADACSHDHHHGPHADACSHDHHHDDGEDCTCGHHHHDDDGEEGSCGHHHHGPHADACSHDHHHDDGEECSCGHHHADEVFTSWGVETARKFTADELTAILQALSDTAAYGTVLRAKGIVDGGSEWLHFDYVPGESNVRTGAADVTGRLCVIGAGIDEGKLAALFGIA